MGLDIEVVCLHCEKVYPLRETATYFVPRTEDGVAVQKGYPVSVCKHCTAKGHLPQEMKDGIVIWTGKEEK